MSKKKTFTLTATILLCVSVLIIIPNMDWTNYMSIIGFVVLVLGTGGSIISIFIPSSFTLNFENSDWKNIGNSVYELEVSAKKHGMGKSPKSKIFFLREGNYTEALNSPTHDKDGNIKVHVMTNHRIGKLVVF